CASIRRGDHRLELGRELVARRKGISRLLCEPLGGERSDAAAVGQRSSRDGAIRVMDWLEPWLVVLASDGVRGSAGQPRSVGSQRAYSARPYNTACAGA